MRTDFFGATGDTRWNQVRLPAAQKNFLHHELDIRQRPAVLALLKEIRTFAIVHTGAQPSHVFATSRPFDDFDVNAYCPLNMLDRAHLACQESPFAHMSTNKVYGDTPNKVLSTELPKRWNFADPAYADDIS